MKRTCLECGTQLTGRIDQKFCCDQCRNSFNNKRNRAETSYMRHVGRQLKKNRRILRELRQAGMETVDRQILISLGFNFSYFTSLKRNGDGSSYYFCFEQGYLPMKGDIILLIPEGKR